MKPFDTLAHCLWKFKGEKICFRNEQTVTFFKQPITFKGNFFAPSFSDPDIALNFYSSNFTRSILAEWNF